jgi:transcription termination factor NusB
VTVAKVGRRQSRRTALFLLYQWDITGQPLASLYDGTPDDFALELAEAVAARAAQLDERISAASDAWSADRLGTLERNVLRVGVYELEEGTVPPERRPLRRPRWRSTKRWCWPSATPRTRRAGS